MTDYFSRIFDGFLAGIGFFMVQIIYIKYVEHNINKFEVEAIINKLKELKK